jgi:hypothetical protein
MSVIVRSPVIGGCVCVSIHELVFTNVTRTWENAPSGYLTKRGEKVSYKAHDQLGTTIMDEKENEMFFVHMSPYPKKL